MTGKHLLYWIFWYLTEQPEHQYAIEDMLQEFKTRADVPGWVHAALDERLKAYREARAQ